jgi:hypothetical protein
MSKREKTDKKLKVEIAETRQGPEARRAEGVEVVKSVLVIW